MLKKIKKEMNKIKKAAKKVVEGAKKIMKKSFEMKVYDDVKEFIDKEPENEELNDAGTLGIALGGCVILLGIAAKIIAR